MTIPVYTNSDIAPIMKQLYPDKRIADLTYTDHPFLALVRKEEDFTGSAMKIPVKIGNTNGRNHTFTTAQTAAQGDSFKTRNFLLTRAKNYQLFTMDNETLEATANDRGAFVKALDFEREAAQVNIAQSLAMEAWGAGDGIIGVVGSLSSQVVTLSNINAVTNFEIGQTIVASTTRTGAVVANGTGVITAIDYDLGAITMSGTITGMTAGKFLGISGDTANGGTSLAMSGVGAWIPTTAPTSGDSFFGLDRSVSPTRLGGLRFDASALNYEELVISALSRLGRDGGRPDYLFVNDSDWRGVVTSLGSKVETSYVQVGDIGFETINLRGSKGTCKLMADRDVPAGYGYALEMKSWVLASLNKAPHLINNDGNSILRQSSADGVEGRLVAYANVGCYAPGHNMVITLPS